MKNLSSCVFLLVFSTAAAAQTSLEQQIENKLDAAIRMQLALQIPLVK